MVKSDVKFIVRILPSPKRDWECIKVEKNRKTIHIKRLQTSSLHPGRSLYWEFNTDGIITDSCQDVIYHKVTENTLNKVFKGVDMVVIAFGQSDTGKTYTMLGLEDGYNYRGIAPRILKDTLEIADRYGPGMEFCVTLSFVEFDNNKCFNLLKSPPELVDSKKEHGAFIKSLREGLALLFDGHKRRKFEKEHNHCAPAVVTIHIKGIPVSGSSTSNIFSAIHIVDMPGTEQQYRHVRSDFCQADANLSKLALDKAKTWDNILAKQNAGCQVMGRCPSVFKSSNLIQYLGRSITNGVLRLVGHIRAEHHNLKNTLWTLKYGGRLSRKQPGEMLYTFSPDYRRLAQLLEEEVKQLKDEIVVSELLRGEYTQLNMCQGEVEHLDRLVKSYVDGRVTEAALLSAAKPNVILHSMKKLYANDLGDLKTAFNARIKSAAEAMAKELAEEKTPPAKKKSRHSPLIGSKDMSSSMVALPTKINASVSGPSGTGSSANVSEMAKTKSASFIEAEPSEQTVRTSTKPETAAKTRKNSKKTANKSVKASASKEVEPKLENEEVEAGQKSREENWKEWESKNKEKAGKLNQLKEAFKNSTIESEKTVNEVSDLRTNLAALQSQLEEARWERMVNFGEHPGIDGARFVTSAAEQALEEGIKALKKEIYDKVTHMVNDHKEHMRKLEELNNAQIAAEADFREYVESTKPPLVLFPPIEDLDLVPLNPTTSSFQDVNNYGETKSETEFEIVQSQRFHQKKFKPKKKWQ